jgi:predicted ATPase
MDCGPMRDEAEATATRRPFAAASGAEPIQADLQPLRASLEWKGSGSTDRSVVRTGQGASVTDTTFITRVVVRNYKSIAACDVRLRSLSFLVGPNGSGKSNFLDSLRFVADSLNTSLDHALRDRGGIKEVRRRSGGHPTHFSIDLQVRLRDGAKGRYAFRVGARKQGGYEVQHEECRLRGTVALEPEAFFRVRDGVVEESSLQIAPAASSDRLYLVNASGLSEFRPLYEALSHMGFYNLNPDRIRDLQPPDAGDVLLRDGSNLASVLGQLVQHNPATKQRIEEYLSAVVPGITGVDIKQIGPKETLEFRQKVGASEFPWRFFAANMSDGTVRALGVLVALFQSTNGRKHRVPLVGIEEPELALHPAASGVLRDCLRDASLSTQVIVTSHSPDLLDDPDIPDDWILPVLAEQGATRIGPMDDAGRTMIRDKLYTAGELLRMDQLKPMEGELPEEVDRQMHLLDEDSP